MITQRNKTVAHLDGHFLVNAIAYRRTFVKWRNKMLHKSDLTVAVMCNELLQLLCQFFIGDG